MLLHRTYMNIDRFWVIVNAKTLSTAICMYVTALQRFQIYLNQWQKQAINLLVFAIDEKKRESSREDRYRLFFYI